MQDRKAALVQRILIQRFRRGYRLLSEVIWAFAPAFEASRATIAEWVYGWKLDVKDREIGEVGHDDLTAGHRPLFSIPPCRFCPTSRFRRLPSAQIRD